jgi:hypothetical protein
MDNTVLKKKLSTFRSPKGNLVGVSAEVLIELLKAWENWTGPAREFYQSIGVNRRQAARILGKAKKIHREGGFPASEFSELKVADILPAATPCSGIELNWSGGQVIRFPRVDELLDFLKKAA